MSESALAETLAEHIAGSTRRRRAADVGGDRSPGPPSPSWPAGSRGSRCGSPSGPTMQAAASDAARRRGGRDPAHPHHGGRRRGLRCRRRGHRGRGGPGARRRRADPRAGRVADRRPGRVAAGQRARGQSLVPGFGGLLRLGSQVSASSACRRDPVVSEEAARAMAEGARRVLGSDVGLSITGVAGPDSQDDQPPGTVFVGLARSGPCDRVVRLHRARVTGTGSASTPPSPRSTSCDARWGVSRRGVTTALPGASGRSFAGACGPAAAGRATAPSASR